MGDTSGNIYHPSNSAHTPHSGQPSNSNERNVHYLGENAQSISVQFKHSCHGQDTTQLDPDILQRRHSLDEDHPTTYPEPSQRTTSYASSPYVSDASRFNNFFPYDPAMLDIVDAPSCAAQTFRRGSWPSHAQMEYDPWAQLPSRMARSPASEPPESISDESHQDSDVEDVTRMSPMMNQFQIQPSRGVDLPHMYPAQALQPSVMTFQLSESELQPVNSPESRNMLHSFLEMSIIADDELEITHPPPSSPFWPSSSNSLGSAGLQGPSTRLRRDSEKVTRTSQNRVQVASNSIPFPSSRSPTNAHVGDQRSTGSKQQKKSKMHQCEQCKKMFPRPSGLATHMNSHSGAKPYKCIVQNCGKSFAVRSNAKRHLRTHGINPASADALSLPRYTVGFDEPVVTQIQDAGRQPSRYRWITHNPLHESEWLGQGPSSTMDDDPGLTFQASTSSMSSTMSNRSDDDYDEEGSPDVADAQQFQGGYNRNDFSATYPNYGDHGAGET